MTPTEKVDIFALLQAIGVVAVYAFIKDGIPRLFKKNGSSIESGDIPEHTHKIEQCPLSKDMMNVEQHDRECKLKLRPIYEKQNEMHEDIKTLLRASGLHPKNGR